MFGNLQVSLAFPQVGPGSGGFPQTCELRLSGHATWHRVSLMGHLGGRAVLALDLGSRCEAATAAT